MPIENLEQTTKDGELAIQNQGIVVNSVIHAGLAVRHKLLPHRYLLDGFVVEDRAFNYKEFESNGINISCQSIVSTCNPKLYSKLVLDGKRKCFYEFFNTDEKFVLRDTKDDSPHHIGKDSSDNTYNLPGLGWTNITDVKFEYYLYETTTSILPECAANKVFALCKYYEEGEFKYSIFNLHEIVPEV